MTDRAPNVKKLDVQPLDILRSAIQGFSRLNFIRRSVKIDMWRGSVAAEEITITVESNDARH